MKYTLYTFFDDTAEPFFFKVKSFADALSLAFCIIRYEFFRSVKENKKPNRLDFKLTFTNALDEVVTYITKDNKNIQEVLQEKGAFRKRGR